MTLRFWMAACAAALLTAGCSSDDGGDDGAAPKIQDLALTPLEVDVGKSSAISGTVAIDDPDGDVAQIGVVVTLPNGTTQSLPKAPAQGANGMKQGQLAVALLFGPPLAGSYELDFFVVDSKGHESNHLSMTVSGK